MRNFVSAAVALGIFAVVLGFFGWWTMWVTIEPGEVGIKKWYGAMESDLMGPGPHLVHPLKSVVKVNCQTQKEEEDATVPVKKGLNIGMKAKIIYHVADASRLLTDTGKDFAKTVVVPFFEQAVRDGCSEFEAESFYSEDREKIEARVLAIAKKKLSERGIEVETIMLLNPVLPSAVRDSIESKIAAEQAAIKMESVFKQRELEGKANKRVKELDAEAKVIEAKGIAEAQNIIKKDLDHNYLVYLWIESLRESAKHNNATIYIPTGNDGMPLFKTVK